MTVYMLHNIKRDDTFLLSDLTPSLSVAQVYKVQRVTTVTFI